MINYEIKHVSESVDDAPWVILIHGLFGSLDNLSAVARSLGDACNCLLIDLPNHGLSETVSDLNYSTISDAIVDILNRESIDQAHLIGHSLGGKVAMHFGLHYQDKCSSLIIADIAPFAYPHRHAAVFDGIKGVDLDGVGTRRDALQQLSKHVKEPPTQQFLLKGLYRHEDRWQWRFRVDEIIASYPELIGWPHIEAQYSKPVLFIIGGESDYVTQEHNSVIRSLFPNVKAKIIQGTGHWLHAEKPVIFNKIVNDHIRSLI